MQLANLESGARVHRARRSPAYDLDCPHHFLVSISPGLDRNFRDFMVVSVEPWRRAAFRQTHGAQGWPTNQLISAPRGLSVWGWEVATGGCDDPGIRRSTSLGRVRSWPSGAPSSAACEWTNRWKLKSQDQGPVLSRPLARSFFRGIKIVRLQEHECKR